MSMCRKAIWLTLVPLACVACDAPQAGSAWKWDLGARTNGQAWTILCLEAGDPQRQANVEALADGLRRLKELDRSQVRVEHGPQVSRIYYGTYYGSTDRATGRWRLDPRCARDVRHIRSLSVGEAMPFLMAKPTPRPTAREDPPEWDLRNAAGMYTLQICYCINKPGFPDRREGAVAIVRQFRSEGEQAYYYHGSVKSLVCVGSFDGSAVIADGQGRYRYSEEVVELQNRREDFQFNTEWLQKVYRIGPDGQRSAAKSFLVEIPRDEESPLW